MSIRSFFDQAVAQAPDHTAVQYRVNDHVEGRTYGEMAARVAAIAELADELNLVPRRSPVAIILDNSPAWMEIYLAHAGCGFAVVPIDPKLRPSEVAYMLRDAGAVALCTDQRHLPMLAEMAPNLPELRHIVLADGPGDGASPSECAGIPCHRLEERIAALAARAAESAGFYQTHAARDEDIASIIYTSGTTGQPKGALLTHANFCADANGALQLITDVGRDDSFMIVLPLFHSFSFMANFIVPIRIGARMQFVSSLRNVSEDLNLFRPSVLMAVPLLADKIYERISKEIRRSLAARLLISIGLRGIVARRVRAGLGGALRLVVVGGAPCPRKTLVGVRRLGFTIIEGYGLTEAAPIVSVTKLDSIRPGTIGVPLPNIEIRIADPDAKGVGELLVRGPTVMRGYHNRPEETAATIVDGWLHTGDLVSRDSDGHLSIRGRSKALIVNREGKNIYPEEVEACIGADPRILDVLVIGYTEKDAVGEKVGAIISPNLENFKKADPADPDWDEIERSLRDIVHKRCQKLSDYKHPRKIIMSREPLERNSIQKIRRHVYQGRLDTH